MVRGWSSLRGLRFFGILFQPFSDRPEVSQGCQILFSACRLLGVNDRIEVEKLKTAISELPFYAAHQGLLIVAYPRDFAETVEDSQISLQVQIFQTRREVRSKFQRQLVCSQAMAR